MRKKTECDGFVVETFALSDGQHQIAVKAIKKNLRSVGNYKVKEVTSDEVEIWLEDADDIHYKNFLHTAVDNGADVYTLTDNIGGFGQPIGEIIVY